MELGPLSYLHPKKSDAGEKVHSGFEVLESLWAAGWKVILLEGRREVELWKKAREDGKQYFRGNSKAPEFQEVCWGSMKHLAVTGGEGLLECTK